MGSVPRMTVCLITAIATSAAEAEERAVMYANQAPPAAQPGRQAQQPPPWAVPPPSRDGLPSEVPSDFPPAPQDGRPNGPPARMPFGNIPGGPQMQPGLAPGMSPGPYQGIPPGGLPGQEPIFGPPLRMRDVSLILIGSPPVKKIKVHDLVTVVVNENAEVVQNTRFNRQRNARLQAQLRSFVRINDKANLDTAAPESPSINGQLQSQLQASGTGLSQEGMRYRIAATVVEVLPNGTMILEARKSLQTNRDVWEYKLTGRIRSEDVQPNNTVMSENIADLNIVKSEFGKIRDSGKRGILMTLYDWLLPF